MDFETRMKLEARRAEIEIKETEGKRSALDMKKPELKTKGRERNG